MNVLIIEDEDLAVRKLRKLVAEVDPTLTVQGVTASIEDSVNWLRNNTVPDLIFMDIELADGQSFEIFNQVEIRSRVIFTTSYDEYVLPAFRNNSIDYLLKPILKEDLQQSLIKLHQQEKEITQTESPPGIEPINVQKLLDELQEVSNPADSGYKRSFLAKQGQKLLSVDVDDIMYFYADQQFSSFQMRNGQKFNLDYSIDELAAILDPKQFFCVDEKTIVTRNAVTKIQSHPGNQMRLRLRTVYGNEVILSQEKIADFKIWMNK